MYLPWGTCHSLQRVVAEVQPIAGSRVDDRKPQRLSRRKIMSRKVLGLLVVVVLIVIVLFATGFWSADVKEGAMPDVDISAEGGKLPGVDMDSKEVVVGTTKTEIDVPKIETEKQTVDVPAVGVKDDGEE
jgi:hypothetical protein